MKKISCDILIVGAGLTGLLAALSLSNMGLKTILLDRYNYLLKKDLSLDLRTTAISEGSKQFLDKIKIWKEIKKFAEPIKNIKVIDRLPSRKISFSNSQQKENLGYIVRNTHIKEIILEKLTKDKNIRMITKQNLQNINNNKECIICEFDTINVEAKLLVAADGKNSKIRNLCKTPVYKKEFKQKALVVNFHHTKNHNSTAFELFFNSGPLAVLPMKKILKNSFSSSLIYSHDSKTIDSLFAIQKNLLHLVLEEKIKNYVGNIKQIIDIQKFELSAHINKSFSEQNLIYLGDSAHSIHPIAGQGWNIGVRDIEKFINILKKKY
jgi:2-octaprenyl-6-methoxyphenol hydroxylase